MGNRHWHSLKKLLSAMVLFILMPFAVAEEMRGSPVFGRHDIGSGLPQNTVTVISQDRAGFLWFGTLAGLSRFDGYGFTNYSYHADDPNSLSNNFIYDITEDSQGYIWIASYRGLNRFDPRKQTFQRYFNNPDDLGSLSDNYPRAVFEDRDGVLWTGNKYGLNRYDRATNRFRHYYQLLSREEDFTVSIQEDKSGRLWLGVYGHGILIFDKRRGEFSRLELKKVKDLTQANNVWQLLIDKQNRVWAATEAGVLEYHIDTQDFRFHAVGGDKNLNRLPRSLYLDLYGDLWVGTQDGRVYRYNPNQQTWSALMTEKGGFSGNSVLSIYTDRSNVLWLGSELEGLIYFKPDNPFRLLHFAPPHNNVWAITRGEAEDLWIGTTGGQVRLKSDGTSAVYRQRDKRTVALNQNNIETVFKDSNGRLWVFSNNMLAFQDPTQNRLQPFPIEGFGKVSMFTDITEDKARNLWISSDNGLYQLDSVYRLAAHYKAERFDGSILYSLVHDGEHIWLGTDNGLWYFDPVTTQTIHFGEKDGLQPNEFNRGARYVDIDGTIYMGGIRGVTVFHPQKIINAVKSLPPPVVITRLLIDNKPVAVGAKATGFTLPASLPYMKDLEFDFKQSRFFSLEFSALDYTAPLNNRYAYKLEGLNSGWIYTDAESRRAVYTALPPGSYVFRVKAANAEGVWNEEGTRLAITIRPPWWQTNLAKITYLGFLLFAVVGYARLRTFRIEQQARSLENEVERRTQEIQYQAKEIEQQKNTIEVLLKKKNALFANVSHELRTPLTLILGPVARLLKQDQNETIEADLLTIKRNGQRLSSLVEQLLAFSRISHVEQLKSQPRLLSLVVESLQASLQPLMNEKNLAFEVKNHPDIWVSVVPEDTLETILLNLLTNAVKYTTTGGSVSLNINKLKNNKIEILVKDNGDGIPEDRQVYVFERFARLPKHIKNNIPGAGLGLALVKELVELNDGILELNSNEGKGTEFRIELKSCASPGKIDHPYLVNQPLDIGEILPSPQPVINVSKAAKLRNRPGLLVIDDTADMRVYLRSFLEQNYRVMMAEDGETGIAMAVQHQPDIIICDIMMPGIDGFAVLERLRDTVETSHIPVILLTAKGDRESRLKGLRETADDYIVKPFDAEELLVRIQGLLSIRGMLKRAFGDAYLKASAVAKQETELKASFPDDHHLSTRDKAFMARFQSLIETHHQNPDLKVADMCATLCLSERPLQTKVKSILGCTPNQYLRRYRLERAASLIRGNYDDSLGRLAQEVGFATQQYFTARFTEYYGVAPTEYARSVAADKIKNGDGHDYALKGFPRRFN